MDFKTSSSSMESVKKMPVPSDDDVDMIVTRAATAPNYHDRGTTSIAPGALTSSSTLGNYRVERPQHRNRGSTARARSMPPSVTAPIAPSMNLRRRQRQLESRWAAGILTVLNMEFQDHLHTKVQLKDMAAALEAEKMAHRETQHQLEKKLHDADSMRKSWLEAANHLDRALRQGQAVNQMTDDELIHKAEALRFKIKNFALQFFGDELKTIEQSHATVDLLRTHLNLSPRSLKVYLRSSSLRPMLVRSFLWCYLRKAVFGRFRWVPHESSTAMLDLDRFLRNLATADGRIIAEDAREFHMWRAKTSNLLREATEPEAAAGCCRQESTADAHYIFDILAPYSAANPQVIGTRLIDIIYQSLELDKQFSMQVAKLRWTNINIPVTAFDPRMMEVDRGQTYASPEQQVQLVLSPSLEKWGKSSGEDFDLSTTLLKMEVSIQARPQSYTRAMCNVFTGTPRGPPA